MEPVRREITTHLSPLDPPSCDDRRIWDVWLSAFHGPCLAIADELGVFAALAHSPLTVPEAAVAFQLGNREVEALLGLLTALGFLVQHQERFHLTDVSRNFLLPESRYYWGGFLQRFRMVPITCATLKESLQKGQSEASDGAAKLWKQLDPAKLEDFTHAMHGKSFGLATTLAGLFDGAATRRLLDVGGGSGCFSIALAARHTGLRATVMDLPPVCEVANRYIDAFRLSDRIDTHGLDMFEDPWPSGYDAVFFSDIFHDWDRERCIHLAQKSLGRLPSGGRIHVHEMLLSGTKDSPLPAITYSMAMIFSAHGKQRTAGEIASILTDAGFAGVTVCPTGGYYSLVSAEKP
jgi:predicted O-methyltransferase YrrM